MTIKTNLTSSMERRMVNPWTWQDAWGYVQGNEITGPHRVLACAGQLSTNTDGHLLHSDDMRGQIGLSLDNLETAEFGGRRAAADCKPASTLLGVTRLVFPGQLVELKATACA